MGAALQDHWYRESHSALTGVGVWLSANQSLCVWPAGYCVLFGPLLRCSLLGAFGRLVLDDSLLAHEPEPFLG